MEGIFDMDRSRYCAASVYHSEASSDNNDINKDETSRLRDVPDVENVRGTGHSALVLSEHYKALG